MASRLATKSFARVASASRSRVAPARRTMASVPHTASKGSDTPWIAGSALVFGGTAIYLLAPSGKEKAHAHGAAQAAHHEAPKTIPGFTDKSGGTSTDTPTTDDEGNEVPEGDVKQSMDQGYATDSPVDAGRSESGKGQSGSSPQNSAEAAENAPSSSQGKDPSEAEGDKPVSDKGLDEKQKRSGSFQSPEEEGPTKMTKPRAAAAQGVQSPREVTK